MKKLLTEKVEVFSVLITGLCITDNDGLVIDSVLNSNLPAPFQVTGKKKKLIISTKNSDNINNVTFWLDEDGVICYEAFYNGRKTDNVLLDVRVSLVSNVTEASDE